MDEDSARAVYDEVPRVELTPAAAELLRRLREAHGPLMFHQSGGCCDGSAPMCYPAGEFRTGGSDVLLAELDVRGGRGAGDVLDVAEPVRGVAPHPADRGRRQGRGSGFSLEAPEGVRFLIRSRVVGA